jgi:hypothetical protein
MGHNISKSEESDNTTIVENEASWTDVLSLRNRPVKKCCQFRQNPPPPPPTTHIHSEVEQVPVEDNIATAFTNDTIVNTVIHSFIGRSNLGFKKYGKTLDRTDVNTIEWANHMQEELMDAILYLERLKQDLISAT